MSCQKILRAENHGLTGASCTYKIPRKTKMFKFQLFHSFPVLHVAIINVKHSDKIYLSQEIDVFRSKS